MTLCKPEIAEIFITRSPKMRKRRPRGKNPTNQTIVARERSATYMYFKGCKSRHRKILSFGTAIDGRQSMLCIQQKHKSTPVLDIMSRQKENAMHCIYQSYIPPVPAYPRRCDCACCRSFHASRMPLAAARSSSLVTPSLMLSRTDLMTEIWLPFGLSSRKR